MKRSAIIISFISILLTMIINVGVIRGQENSNMIAKKYQSEYMERIANKLNEDNAQDDKNTGVEILGWIIQHHLLYEYQKIDTRELEERLERSR
jgi:hypothetical protein